MALNKTEKDAIIQEYHVHPNDTGSPEVQVAILTKRINTLIEHEGRGYAVVGSLRDPVEGRPAPIYILDADTYEVLSTIRPEEELGIELAQHLHNVVWYARGGQLYLLCQSWNPGYYFVLERM